MRQLKRINVSKTSLISLLDTLMNVGGHESRQDAIEYSENPTRMTVMINRSIKLQFLRKLDSYPILFMRVGVRVWVCNSLLLDGSYPIFIAYPLIPFIPIIGLIIMFTWSMLPRENKAS